MPNFKTYIGDSVYANFDGYNIIISLDNGDGDYNSIALEPGNSRCFIRVQGKDR